MSAIESYVCLECGGLSGFSPRNPQYCRCGAQNFMSVDRFVETWPEPHFLMQEIAEKKFNINNQNQSTTS